MASTTIHEICRADLRELETAALATITNVKPLSSYNWIDTPSNTPTIAVPGCPALWSAPDSPRRLRKDSGLVYIAQNAARHPESPLEPLFCALYATNPSFDIRSTDIVTDRNNIRKLLAFIDPGSTRGGLEAFTISIEVMKNTAIFCREEAKTLEFIGPQEFRGYGHEFEKAYTATQISDSTGHHRIISYRFSDLNVIVRYETDAYVDASPRRASSTENRMAGSLSALLGSLSLSPASSNPDTTPHRSKLSIRREGQMVPQGSTLEIKTRVSHKPIEIEEVAPQLWVSQTPKLVRAYHQKGTFQRPVVEDVAAAIKSWEGRQQNNLRKLAALIQKVISITKEAGGNTVLKYDVGGDKLAISKVERKEMLPEYLYSKWNDPEARSDNQKYSKPGSEVAQTRPEHIATMRTEKDDLKATIRIGSMEYSVDMSKIPYLASFVRLQKVTQPAATVFLHEPISLFDVALKGVECGYRQCFRSLSSDLSQYRTLFETYAFLDVDVLSGLSIDEVIANLKEGRAGYDPEEGLRISGNKSLARDAAFQLLFLILHNQSEVEAKDRVKLFNAVMFVVSHPGTFKYRTKRVVRVAYEERFGVTAKQKAGLDKWEKGEVANPETDATTDEESYYYFDSDGSW